MDKQKEIMKEIIELELAKNQILVANLKKKIARFERANAIVKNTIAQQEVDDLMAELKVSELQRKILLSRLKT